jgi:hypothetical protein
MIPRYGVDRLRALFYAYEALPHDPEFVRLAILPTIKAELTTFFTRLMIRDRVSGFHEFKYEAEQAYYEAVANRTLHVIHAFGIKLPIDNDPMIRIEWKLFYYPNLKHSIEIPVEYRSQKTLDDIVSAARDRLNTVNEILLQADSSLGTRN